MVPLPGNRLHKGGVSRHNGRQRRVHHSPSTGEIYPRSFFHRLRFKRGRRAGRRCPLTSPWPQSPDCSAPWCHALGSTRHSRPWSIPPRQYPPPVDRRQVHRHFLGSLSRGKLKRSIYTRPVGLRARAPPLILRVNRSIATPTPETAVQPQQRPHRPSMRTHQHYTFSLKRA